MTPADVKFCWCGRVDPCPKHKGVPKPAVISKKKNPPDPQPDLFDFEEE